MAREVFNGRFNKELYSEYRHWLMYITEMYLPIRDSENGDFRRLPFEGGVGDQPYMTMQVLKIIQQVYQERLHEKMKSIKASGKKRPVK